MTTANVQCVNVFLRGATPSVADCITDGNPTGAVAHIPLEAGTVNLFGTLDELERFAGSLTLRLTELRARRSAVEEVESRLVPACRESWQAFIGVDGNGDAA